MWSNHERRVEVVMMMEEVVVMMMEEVVVMMMEEVVVMVDIRYVKRLGT